MRHIRWMTAICCLIIAAACSKNEGTHAGADMATARQLRFDVGVGDCASQAAVSIDPVASSGFPGGSITRCSGEDIDYPTVKASPVEDLTSYGSFALYGYLYDSWSTSCRPDYMFGEKVRYVSPSWQTEGTFATDIKTRKARFYAIAPYNATGVAVSSSMTGPLSFTYSVPSDVPSQNDLLVGSSGEYTGTLASPAVSFGHCLSAVTFRTGTGTVSGTLRSITLKGVYSTGTYTCGSGWSALSSAKDFQFASDITLTEGQSRDLTSGESTMMLIPQTLGSEAMIEVIIESEGKTSTLTASIEGNQWLEGKKCIYSLSFDSLSGMKISLDVTSLDLAYGEHRDITVTGDPADQIWTRTLTGSGYTAEKISNTLLRVTNTNVSGTDGGGQITVTTQDSKRSAYVSVLARSLQESISLTPTSRTIGYNSTGTFTASGTFPGGYTLNSPTGTSVSKDGNTISVKNTTSSYKATEVTLTAETVLMKKTAGATVILSGKPETIQLDKTTLTVGSSEAGVVTASGDYDSFTASLSSTSYASLSKSGNTLTITNANTSYETKTVTLTATTAGDTRAQATCTVSLSPVSDYVIDYEISSVTLSTSNVGAGGGSITISGGKVTQKWASGKTMSDYADASFTVDSPAVLCGRTITVSSLGTMVKSAATFQVRASYSSGGVTAQTKTSSFTQDENKCHTGSSSTKNHTRTGSVTYGNKNYGTTTYGSKIYGSEYVKSTDYGSEVQDEDTYGNWETTGTETVKDNYSVSFSVTSWSPGSDASSKANTITASHMETPKYSQRSAITHHWHTPYTQHWYCDWTRSISTPYTRSASQTCNYIEYRTDTYDSGATNYVETQKSHTESWTDSGTEDGTDSGSDWYRDSSGSTSRTAPGGYGYRNIYGTPTTKTDSPSPSSSHSWLTYSSGRMNVTENTTSSSRSAVLSVTNGTASASCSVTQSEAEYDIDIN